MIVADINLFPYNVLELVEMPMALIDPDTVVYKRPLKQTDQGRGSIGLSAQTWQPVESSEEIGGILGAASRPTLQRYSYIAQAFVKDADEVRGLQTHGALAQRVRSVLYTFAPLRVALAQLSVPLPDGTTESFQRFTLRSGRFFSSEIQSEHLYLSTIEFWVETATH